jgi:hypothetical protein
MVTRVTPAAQADSAVGKSSVTESISSCPAP